MFTLLLNVLNLAPPCGTDRKTQSTVTPLTRGTHPGPDRRERGAGVTGEVTGEVTDEAREGTAAG